MNVSGLSNLGFSQPANSAGGAKSSSGKGKPSFETILGQTQNLKPQPASTRSTEPSAQKPQTQGDHSPSNGQGKDERRGQAEKPPAAPAKKESNAATKTFTRTSPALGSVGALPSRPANPETPVRSPGDTQNENPAPNAENEGDGEVQASSAESLPTSPPSAPTLGGPTLNDRVLGTPATHTHVNPMAKGAAAITQDDPANTLTRRVVWNDFLRKMNDLGVSAEDVLGAFASLSEKDLAQPPGQSVDKVVMALGLDGQQAVLAKQYFNELISKTQSKSLGEEVAASHKQLSLTMLSQRDLERKSLSNSLDKMNSNFFMNKAGAKPGQVAMDGALNTKMGERSTIPLAGLPPGLEELSLPESAGLPGLEALSTPSFNPAIAQAVPTSAEGLSAESLKTSPGQSHEINDLINEMREIPAGDKKSLEALIKNFNARQATANPNSGGMVGTPSVPGVVTPPAAAPPAALSSLGAIFGGAGGAGGAGGGKSSGDESADDSNSGSAFDTKLGADGRMGVNAPGKGDFQAQMAPVGPAAPQVMGVPELVQQTHLMVKDGGGEMKVTLRPDGLGEVAMRVSVDEGKVTVQMVTESDEAKKLIERQIGDLHNSLTNNHLQVDSIKVDTATNLGKQLEQQYHDAQRQQAQANLEQFRQDQQGWRRSFFDIGTVRPYQNQADAPVDVRAPSSASKKSVGARRLDLVA